MKLIGKQIVVELPEKFSTYEHIEIHGMKKIDNRYNAGFNDALSEVARMNPAWEIGTEFIPAQEGKGK